MLPGEPVRPDGSGKPLDADLIGDVERAARGGRLGGSRGGRGSAAASASGCWPPARTRSRARLCDCCSDGSADVYVGTTEMGQGPRTVMAQIAAEEIGALERARARPRRRHALHAL